MLQRKIKSRSPRLTNSALVSQVDPFRISFNGAPPLTIEEYEDWAERQTAQYLAYHQSTSSQPSKRK